MPVLQPIAATWADIGLAFGATADLRRKIVMKVTAVTVVMCLRPLAKKRTAPAFYRPERARNLGRWRAGETAFPESPKMRCRALQF